MRAKTFGYLWGKITAENNKNPFSEGHPTLAAGTYSPSFYLTKYYRSDGLGFFDIFEAKNVRQTTMSTAIWSFFYFLQSASKLF